MQGHTKPYPTDQKSPTGFKTVLFALWTVIDVIAIALASSFSDGRLGPLWVITSVFLIAGTLHSASLCLSEKFSLSSLKGNLKGIFSMLRIAHFKNGSHRIVAGGLLGAALLATAPLVYSTLPVEPEIVATQPPSANPEVTIKCSEIAGLEQKLFRTDEKTVLSECLIQYGQMGTTARSNAITKK